MIRSPKRPEISQPVLTATEKAREITDLMNEYIKPGMQLLWLKTPLPALNGQTPLQLIQEQRYDEVIAEFTRFGDGQP